MSYEINQQRRKRRKLQRKKKQQTTKHANREIKYKENKKKLNV
jgi:hypothetical protein